MKKKFLIWGGIALVLFFVISDPTAASNTVDSIFGGLENAGDSGAQFLNGVFGGQ